MNIELKSNCLTFQTSYKTNNQKLSFLFYVVVLLDAKLSTETKFKIIN